MNQLATQGIILRRTDYGEADRIITFLTPEYGKIRVMAKGVRKQKSKLAGGIELFSVSELHFIKGRGEIETLVSTRLIRHFGAIVQDYGRTEAAYALLTSINKIVEDHAGGEYFKLLLDTLAALDEERIPQIVTELSFRVRILQQLGNLPDFATNTQGENLQPEDTFLFDYDEVSFRPDPSGSFNKNHLKVLKLLAHNSPQAVTSVKGIVTYCEELEPLVKSIFLEYSPS